MWLNGYSGNVHLIPAICVKIQLFIPSPFSNQVFFYVQMRKDSVLWFKIHVHRQWHTCTFSAVSALKIFSVPINGFIVFLLRSLIV